MRKDISSANNSFVEAVSVWNRYVQDNYNLIEDYIKEGLKLAEENFLGKNPKMDSFCTQLQL